MTYNHQTLGHAHNLLICQAKAEADWVSGKLRRLSLNL